MALSKSEEIAILRDTIARLGTDSYCGPWLAEQLSGIERDIRSDHTPQISLAAVQTQCTEMVATATGKAHDIVLSAEREAKATRERTLKDSEQILSNARAAINAAQAAINRF